MPDFIPGLQLAKRFFHETVEPILTQHFPNLTYSAALLGPGSDVLGFDTPMSTDHDWGPRTLLFLRPEDRAQYAHALHETLCHHLPYRFAGWSTHFVPSQEDGDGDRVKLLQNTSSGPVSHHVEILTVQNFLQKYLGFAKTEDLHPISWLSIPSQKLRSLTAGAVFRDQIGLGAVRKTLAWYPRDVWLYLLAAGWERIGQEEHLMGRAGEVGDELGSTLIAARLVRDLMRLCFLMEMTYAPYPKWFGTAFAQLQCAPELQPLLHSAVRAETWAVRDKILAQAHSKIAALHNDLHLTEPLSTHARPFHNRPFTTIASERFAEAIRAQIQDPRLAKIPHTIGGIDQWSDSTTLLEATARYKDLRVLYAG